MSRFSVCTRESLMIISERFFVRIADLYFDEPKPDGERVDIFRHNQITQPLPGVICVPFPTLVLDLSKSPDELFASMKRDCREKINHARREEQAGGLHYEYSSASEPEWIARFADHFDRCAAAKVLPPASRTRLAILANNRALDISFVLDSSGEILAASTCVLTPKRVRGLYAAASFRLTSAPTQRSFIGRANRYLFWRDILRFKEQGAALFDFGGYYTGTADVEKLQVNRFKSGFGGEVRTEFNCEECVTLRGVVARWAMARRNSWAWRKHSKPNVARKTQGPLHDSRVPTEV
jgi:hypothetical protein